MGPAHCSIQDSVPIDSLIHHTHGTSVLLYSNKQQRMICLGGVVLPNSLDTSQNAPSRSGPKYDHHGSECCQGANHCV